MIYISEIRKSEKSRNISNYSLKPIAEPQKKGRKFDHDINSFLNAMLCFCRP